jgi:hypothetical protein
MQHSSSVCVGSSERPRASLVICPVKAQDHFDLDGAGEQPVRGAVMNELVDQLAAEVGFDLSTAETMRAICGVACEFFRAGRYKSGGDRSDSATAGTPGMSQIA